MTLHRCFRFLTVFFLSVVTAVGFLQYAAESLTAKNEPTTDSLVPPKPEHAVRVATYNTAFSQDKPEGLITELHSDSAQAKRIAGVLRVVRPEIVLLNEFDFSPDHAAIKLFLSKYLEAADGLGEPIRYQHYFTAPVNTGEPSGLDLDNNGKQNDPNDAFGFGRYPGHYGMVVLSIYPIEEASVRTFQKFLWHQLPNAARPINPTTNESFYSDSI